MPDAAPKVARAAQGYTHDPAGFPSLPPAGPRIGWQMPSKRADLCGAAVDAAVAAVQQPGIAPRVEPELVHRANPNPTPDSIALTRTTDPSPDPDPKPGSNAHSDCKRRGGTRGSAQRTQAAWAHPARRAADQGAAPRAEHGAEAPAARSRWANGGSRPRRPPRSQLAAALQLAGTAREDSARLRRTEPPALWTL
jgi:hypothetical protein